MPLIPAVTSILTRLKLGLGLVCLSAEQPHDLEREVGCN